jgi:hypothetical protein
MLQINNKLAASCLCGVTSLIVHLLRNRSLVQCAAEATQTGFESRRQANVVFSQKNRTKLVTKECLFSFKNQQHCRNVLNLGRACMSFYKFIK